MPLQAQHARLPNQAVFPELLFTSIKAMEKLTLFHPFPHPPAPQTKIVLSSSTVEIRLLKIVLSCPCHSLLFP